MKKKKITKKKVIIGIIIVILLVVVLGRIFGNKEDNTSKIETEAIQKRDIATSIAATGTIKTSETKNVVATLTGSKITSVNVKEGQKINVGDVICTFDTAEIQANLASLRQSSSVSAAQGNLGVESARRNLNDAIANKDTQIASTQTDVNSAKTAYDNAQNAVNAAKSGLTEKQNELNAMKANYDAAFASYTSVEAEYKKRENAVTAAQNAYNAGLATVSSSETEYNKYFSGSNQLDPTTGNIIDVANYTAGAYATAEHSTVESNYQKAKADLTSLEGTLNTAKANLSSYQGTFDAALASYNVVNTPYQALIQAVNTMQANVNELEQTAATLKATYDKAVTGLNSVVSQADSTIASMQDAVKNSELSASLSNSQNPQILTLEKQLAEGTLKSTVAGTVTSVNVKKGDIYTGSTIAVIEGVEEFIIEAEIDEYDIPDVEVGMNVLIKTDATREEELTGTVTYTAPSATSLTNSAAGMTSASVSTGGNATYTVKIALDNQNDRLRLGMNARISIITDSKENVWTVPYEAVYEREDGTQYIEILKDENSEEKEELDVQTGIEGSYYVEIISDKIKEGMQVVLPEVNGNDSVEALIEMMGADAGI